MSMVLHVGLVSKRNLAAARLVPLFVCVADVLTTTARAYFPAVASTTAPRHSLIHTGVRDQD